MATRRMWVSLVVLACGIALLAVSVTRSDASAARSGGVFKIATLMMDTPDPAIAYLPPSWTVVQATCAQLLDYPDKQPPAGFRLEPEVAASFPRVSRDGKTFTFTLRRGFRFSNGDPIQASAFARAISRVLAPGVETAGKDYTKDIVGADDVIAGRRSLPVGVQARGYRLTIKFTRAIPDFPERTSTTFFCAVPPTLPADPEGRVEFAGSGPYYVSEYVRGRRIVLRRNRFYGGKPGNVDRFDIDLQVASPAEVIDRVERNDADWGFVPPSLLFEPARALRRKYGRGDRRRFFVKPGFGMTGYLLNSRRPLFRDNARLRQAVNFAVDRPKLVPAGAATPTDQLLPPGIPGARNVRIYPLNGPNARKARSLARGHRHGGKAVLYTIDIPSEQARAQILVRNLDAIGIDVEVKGFTPQAFFGQLDRPDAAFDIAGSFQWLPDYIDPFQYTNFIFDGRLHGGLSLVRFDSPRWNARMRRAARLVGVDRYRAYGDLDISLSRDAAPFLAVGVLHKTTFVSNRVGCIVHKQLLPLAAVCLR